MEPRLDLAKQKYERDGYAVVPQFLSKDELSQLKQLSISLWQRPRNDRIIVDFGGGPLANRRMLLRDAPNDGLMYNHKVNDVYLESPEFRSIFLSSRLAALLTHLLDGPPLIINSLHFTQGSGQRQHFDTWYMPPPVEDRMAVVAAALEDYTPINGPLSYYPGSHLIPKYRFSSGHIRAIEAEMPLCDAYLNAELASRELQKQTFYAKAGDIFIWHSQLLHGGEPILDPASTRRSVVVHYWRYGDLDVSDEYPWFRGLELRSFSGYHLNRAHQTPGEVVATT
jgi:hypothetical protein